MSAGPPDPAAVYRHRRDRCRAEERRLERASRAYSAARLAALAVGLGFLVAGLVHAGSAPRWAWPGAAGGALVLAVLALLHGRLLRRQRRWTDLAALNAQALARSERRWADLPPGPAPPADAPRPLPPFVRDVGVFGAVSLARLLGTARTPVGRATLARWLLAPAPPGEVGARQAAVRELAAEIDFRQELEHAGLGVGVPVDPDDGPAAPVAGGSAEGADPAPRRRPARRPPADPEAFLTWAESPPWLLDRPALRVVSWALPLAVWASLLAALGGLLPAALPALGLLAALALSWGLRGRVDPLLDRVAAGADELGAYAGALAVAEARSWTAPRLARVAADLASEGVPASRWLARLRRRVEVADARHGSFHVIVQTLFLWDLHALAALERWQRRAGPRARRWLEALGELEALAALAALAHGEPGWAFAELREDGDRELVGSGLAHPLLAAGQRVANDVRVGPPGTFLLVTGSNMSGKSTLLRALGANAVLAQAGAPACAAALRLPPLRLATSILVEDSLAAGVSFFMAELLRLKQVVDEAGRARREDRVLLYLLDEVLRGTNSEERREAVRRVLGHLLEAGAIGALSTHDLELGALPRIAAAAVPVHFRETVHPPGAPRPMTFDYRLRPGLATTRNALRLLAAVGLAGESGPDEPR